MEGKRLGFSAVLLLRSIYVEVGSRAEKMDLSLKDAEKLASHASHFGFSSCSESNLQPRPGSTASARVPVVELLSQVCAL